MDPNDFIAKVIALICLIMVIGVIALLIHAGA